MRIGVDRDDDGIRDGDDSVLDPPTTLTTNTLFHLPIPLGDPPPFRSGEAPRVH